MISPEYTQGWIYEIFASIQGEGLYCGQRQTFVRFAGCNLACDYCDTPSSRGGKPSACRVERTPGSGCFAEIPNPAAIDQVVAECRALGCRVVSITGGEPLLQLVYLENLMSAMKAEGLLIHLETNGTLYREVSGIVQHADVIAMDIKLPSAAGNEALWDDHSKFLDIASGTEVFVKAVVSADTTEDEINCTTDIIAAIDPNIPLVIQPVTGRAPVPGNLLLELQGAALTRLSNVRVIPQCHKILGLA